MDTHNESTTFDEDAVFTVIVDMFEQLNLSDNLAERTLSRCRNLLNNVFLSESATDSDKRRAIEKIDLVLNLIKPYTLIGEKDTDRTTLLTLIDYMISIIETHGSPQLDDTNIMEDIISLRPTEIFLKVSCRNVILCLEEFKEVLKRADGNQTTDHQLDYRSPFLTSEYFCFFFLSEEQTLRVERYFYPFEPVDLFSTNRAIELTKIIDEETNGAMPNSLLLEKYIKKANVCLESHKNELSCENNPIKMSLDEKFTTMIMYLMRFTELIDVENFDENQEPNKKVLKNLKDFYYILTTLPLTQVLNPFDTQKTITYFKDVIFAITTALTPDQKYSSLVQILMKLHTAAYQLWHMCLKQETTVNKAAACVIYLEYQAQMDIQADVITENSLSDWKVKFGRLANKEEVLSGCNLDSCCICFQPFVDEDTNSTPRDLAVLPKCIHLFCVECLEQSIAKSEVK